MQPISRVMTSESPLRLFPHIWRVKSYARGRQDANIGPYTVMRTAVTLKAQMNPLMAPMITFLALPIVTVRNECNLIAFHKVKVDFRATMCNGTSNIKGRSN